MKQWIIGRNPVYEVLRANRRHLFRLQLAEGVEEKGIILDIGRMARKIGVSIERIDRHKLSRLGDKHQGVCIEVSDYPYQNVQDIIENANDKSEKPFILILDVIQDPQNLGTLLRTAEAVGVHGVVLPMKRSATITPAVVSSSSGATEHLIIAQANLSQTINLLKENDVWVYGLEKDDTSTPIDQANLSGAVALVVGSEGQGLRSLTMKSCDELIYLPMVGNINSLNAAAAGSVALYRAFYERQ